MMAIIGDTGGRMLRLQSQVSVLTSERDALKAEAEGLRKGVEKLVKAYDNGRLRSSGKEITPASIEFLIQGLARVMKETP